MLGATADWQYVGCVATEILFSQQHPCMNRQICPRFYESQHACTSEYRFGDVLLFFLKHIYKSNYTHKDLDL